MENISISAGLLAKNVFEMTLENDTGSETVVYPPEIVHGKTHLGWFSKSLSRRRLIRLVNIMARYQGPSPPEESNWNSKFMKFNYIGDSKSK